MRQTPLTLAEIDKFMPMASSYPDRWGRCIIQLSVDHVFTLKKFTQLLYRLDSENQERDVVKRRSCQAIISRVRVIKSNSDAQYEKRYGCLTRVFIGCFCCLCIQSCHMADLTKLERRLQQPFQQGKDDSEADSSVALN